MQVEEVYARKRTKGAALRKGKAGFRTMAQSAQTVCAAKSGIPPHAQALALKSIAKALRRRRILAVLRKEDVGHRGHPSGFTGVAFQTSLKCCEKDLDIVSDM